jgi:hypothetical protein
MAVALALMLGAIPIVAGAQPAQTDTPSEAAVDAVVAQSDDVRALVAPAALYPDPILALVLQASTLPLQVVQAERFLDRRAKDSSLQPNPDWDKSIIGLLNYPRQVESMAEYIDWTEELGNAVVDNLDEVQASVQEIRLAAYYAGYLKSNKQQKVEVKDEVVRITSTDAQKVSIPQYDPAALLTALDEVEEAEDAADEAVAAPAVPASKAPATPAPQPSPPVAQPAIPAGSASAPMVETVPATPVTYAQPVTAPAIAYGEPEDSFWGDAATFAGGAVVGGLLGWGLTEAFDDDDNDWFDDDDWDNDDVQEALRDRREFQEERREDVLAARDERRNDRQEGATVRRESRDEVRGDREATRDERLRERSVDQDEREQARGEAREDRAARAREELNERPTASGGRTKPAAAGSASAKPATAKVQRGNRDVKLPGAGTQAGVTEKVKQRSGGAQQARATGRQAAPKLASAEQKRAARNTGFTQKRDGPGIAAGTGTSRQVRAEANRGARSRVAQTGGGSRQATAVSRGGGERAVAQHRAEGGAGRGIASDRNRGAVASRDGDRGRASRGGGGEGRRSR